MGGDQGRGKFLRPPAAAAGSEHDEEQMEEFFGLLRRIGDMKGRRRTLGGVCSPRKKARALRSTAWMPAFEWEDFAGEVVAPRKRTATAAISSENGEDREEEKVKEQKTLDLKLSL